MEIGDWIAAVYFTGWVVVAASVLVSSLRGNWSGDDAALMAIAGCAWPLLIVSSPVIFIEWVRERRVESLERNENAGRDGGESHG